jgi:hypothetical protein
MSTATRSAAETPDMSPSARRIVALTLLLGVLFLGSLGAYVWYGVQQFQKLP